MKCANHLEAAKDITATETTVVLAAADIRLCFDAATIPIETMEKTCNMTSSMLRTLYAARQLLQFTTWDQYLQTVEFNH